MLLHQIKLAREAGIIKRYHQVRIIHPETVAEHSFNLVNLMIMLTEGKVSRNCIINGLLHDMGEWAVGDIPSNIKRLLSKEAKDLIATKEEEAIAKVQPSVAMLACTDDERHLIDLCDKLDGLLKCTEELKMGNQHIIPVGERYVGYIQDAIEHDPAYRLECECIIADFRSRYLK